MALTQIAFAEAYELKAGGFRGAALNKITKEIKKGEIRETLAQARADGYNFALEFIARRPFCTGTYRHPRNAWKMTFFVNA